MKKYIVNISESAEQDLLHAAYYIKYVLKNNAAAMDLIDEAEVCFDALRVFQKRHQLVSDPVLAALQLRAVGVKNYLLIYYVVEETNTVRIIRFLHQKSNWMAILKVAVSEGQLELEMSNDTTTAALEEGRKMMKKYKKYLQCTCE